MAAEIADRYWAEVFFGMSLHAFRQAGLHIISQAGDLTGYRGVFALHRLESCIVSCPPSTIERVRSTLHWASITKLLDPEFLVPDAERVVGPAWVGYLDDELSIPRESPMGLLTGSSLVARLPELEHECDPVDWEHCGLNNSTPFITGYERNGKLVAAAGYELWGDTIAHIGVITHPTHRGKGLGRLVVREAARHALSQQLLPQYRTLIANVPAMRIGESLQFKKYAESIAVRLRSADSPI